MVTLKNANRRRAAGPYNLPADILPDLATEVEMQQQLHDRATGEIGARLFTKQIGTSIWFLADEVKGHLPDAVLVCPEIASALERGELVRL